MTFPLKNVRDRGKTTERRPADSAQAEHSSDYECTLSREIGLLALRLANMELDEESDYSYDYDDTSAQGAFVSSEVDGGIAALLESEVADVNSKFGRDLCHYVKATDCDRVRYGPNFNGLIYFFFSVKEKASIGHLWGFDPSQPIVVRFAHYFVTDAAPLSSRKDLLVTVYQGDEPLLLPSKGESQIESNDASSTVSGPDGESNDTSSTASGSVAKNVKRIESLKISTPVHVIDSISSIPLRVGDQVKQMTEEYLMKGLKGLEDPNGQPIALSLDSLQKQCQACTYLNAPNVMRCRMCDGNEMIPVCGEGLLLRLYSFMFEKIQRLNLYCVNCMERHLGGIIQPSYPTVCQRELCQWSLTELGIGRARIDDMALHAEVVDLLIAMTRAAANSSRSEKILSPFPLVYVKTDDGGKEKALDPEKPEFAKVAESAKLLPSMQQVASLKNENQLEEICNESGKFVYGLLQWIITSCPARIISLQGDHRLRSMGTEYQFLVRSASPEHEEVFAQARQEHGSSFAFHGSSIENWHSILRKGLLNCSGTPLQMNGKSYGDGVYLSTNASVSLGYSKIQQRGSSLSRVSRGSNQGVSNRFISDKHVCAMALCEVINDGLTRKNGYIWVVPNEKNVIIRFLFVFVPSLPGFPEAFRAASSCKTTDGPFDREIRTLCGCIADNGLYH